MSNTYAQERYRSDPDRFKAEVKVWQIENPEKVKEYKRKYKINNKLRSMYHAAKKRASIYNVPFELAFEDIIVPDLCPILGLKLEHGQGKAQDNSPSLDRIIPHLGYVPGNVKVISYRANRYKSDLTRDQFIKFIEYIDGELNT